MTSGDPGERREGTENLNFEMPDVAKYVKYHLTTEYTGQFECSVVECIQTISKPVHLFFSQGKHLLLPYVPFIFLKCSNYLNGDRLAVTGVWREGGG